MKKITNILLLLSLLGGCTFTSDNKGISYDGFPIVRNLSARTLSLDTALFRYPFRIRVQDNKATVMDLHGTEYYFHLFHYPDFHYLASFGKRGEAPDEMLSAENIRWNGRSGWILDANKSELTQVELALAGDSLVRQDIVNLDTSILRALDFVEYNDSTFIIPDYSGDNRFCWVNRQGKLLRKTGTIPSVNKDALNNSRPALAQAWRSFIDYNPRNGVLAAVTQLGEVLEIYNLKDNTHIVRIGPHKEPEFQISEGYGIPTGIMGFSDIQVTDNAIYTVFHGHSFKELEKNARKGIDIDGGKYIYVFSLTGEPLCKYVLDHYIYGISVDEDRGIILATDVNEDEPIVEYSIKT